METPPASNGFTLTIQRSIKAGYRVALCEQVASNMSVSKGQENPQEDD
jgi:hypothetical protein